jgi:hypothetical protein
MKKINKPTSLKSREKTNKQSSLEDPELDFDSLFNRKMNLDNSFTSLIHPCFYLVGDVERYLKAVDLKNEGAIEQELLNIRARIKDIQEQYYIRGR